LQCAVASVDRRPAHNERPAETRGVPARLNLFRLERDGGQADLDLASVGLTPHHEVREWVPADELFCFRANKERLLWVRLEKERTRTHVALLEYHEKEVTALRPERIGTRPPCLRSAVPPPFRRHPTGKAAVTGILGHKNIEITRRLYAADWREAEERNALVLRQLADAGIGQLLRSSAKYATTGT
jgi:hypothetical protein